MPVAFTSNGYDTATAAEAWADSHPSIGLAKYGVRSPLDWKVTAVAGQDRTVSIAAGRGFGHGVTDKTIANDTIQLDAPSSGSRWDLIACRRDWTTTGVTSFVKVNGGAAQAIPGGRQSNPGGIDDQPLALVQITAGQSQLTDIIDLRTWAGDGGALVANHDLVRTFLNTAGTRLNIKGVDWLRRVGENDVNEWVKLGEAAKLPLFGVGGVLAGSAPAAGTGVLVQAGTSVLTTDNSGFATITFPAPFPNGLIAFIPSNGDMSVDRALSAALTFGVSGGAPWGTGSKTSAVISVERYNAAPQTHTNVRCNWIAIGW